MEILTAFCPTWPWVYGTKEVKRLVETVLSFTSTSCSPVLNNTIAITWPPSLLLAVGLRVLLRHSNPVGYIKNAVSNGLFWWLMGVCVCVRTHACAPLQAQTLSGRHHADAWVPETVSAARAERGAGLSQQSLPQHSHGHGCLRCSLNLLVRHAAPGPGATLRSLATVCGNWGECPIVIHCL